ncbi:MAG: hypothetical protein KF856_00075 [Cyclobacteriaceae bacterium]|nr:hypothetical protein [Cyclobacteriaceae bacterium]
MRGGLTIILSFVVFYCYGQFKFEALLDDRGAPIRSVTCLLKDNTGFLWIGTQTGLIRYDGNMFLQFHHMAGDSLSLPSSFITSLAEDEQGRLWVGTQAGLCYRDHLTGVFVTVFRKHKVTSNPSVSSILAVTNGIWFGTYDGLSFYDFQTNQITTFPLPASNPLGRMSKAMPQVRAIAKILSGVSNTLWVATGSGLHQFDILKQEWRYELPAQPSLNDSIASALLQHIYLDQETIWAGSWGKGLMQFQTDGKLYNHYSFSNSNLPEGTKNIARHCTKFTYQGISGILVGTYDAGLMFFNPQEKSFTNIPLDGTQVVPVEDVLWDKQGILWVASPHGLYKADPFAQRFAWYAFEEKLFFNNFRSVTTFCQADSSSVLIVVRSNGLYLFNKTTNQIQPLDSRIYHKLENITAIHNLSNGWFFLAGRKMSGWWHMPTDRFKPLPEVQRALAIIPDSDNNLLIPSFNKLVEVNLQTQLSRTIINTNDSTQATAFYDAIYTDDSTLLVASSKGLWKVNTIKHRANYVKDSPHIVNALARQGKRIFVGTHEGLFEWVGNKLIPIPVNGSLPFTIVAKILVQGDYLWLTTNNGVVRFTTADGSTTHFTNEDGLQNNFTSSYSIYKLNNGHLLLGQTGGFFVINPDNLTLNRAVPKPVLTHVEVAGKVSYLHPNQKLALAYNQNQISFAFAALNFAQPQRNQYAHRLIGVSSEWNRGNTATYAGMNGGNYILEIKASNNDGLWSEVVQFPILIRKPFWKQTWFITLVIVVTLLCMYLLYRYQLAKRLELLAMRIQIASDLHDEVGSAISSISLAAGMARSKNGSEIVKIVNQIEATSRETMDNMADIVWSIEPTNDTLIQITERMKRFAESLLGAIGIELHFKVEATKGNLNMIQRKNIYLIFKEALNNVAKYSQAKDVCIILMGTPRTFKMIIQDNGVGFNTQQAYSGNGIRNMQRRATEIHAQLALESNRSTGTCITLTVATI